MRTIDANALIKILEPHSMRNGAALGWHSGLIDSVIDEIRKMPTVGGWISVKENLPKVSGHYLVSCVTNKTGHRWEVPVNAEWLTSRREWYIETENCLASAAGVTVTHYMPLPEQPKENEDE